MDEKERREYFETFTKEELIRLVLTVLENEEALRKELDEVKGIIR